MIDKCIKCEDVDCANCGKFTILAYDKEKGWNYRPVKENKMEFDKSRVYTALNADELKQGDKVIVARSLSLLKTAIENAEKHIKTLEEVNDEGFAFRFVVDNTSFPIAYLIERKDNCTNCGNTDCPNYGYKDEYRKTLKCMKYKPKTEPKAEKEDNMWNYEGLPTKQEMGVSDRVVVAIEGYNIVDVGYYDYDLEGWFVEGCRYPVRVYAWMEVKPPRVEE